MKGLLYVILSIVLTMVCWGVYGPVLQQGQAAMNSGLRPFICVGLAYFVIAVIAPSVLLKTVGEKGHWSATGVFWSLFAGVVTAIGALGIILAIGARGSPLYVMPLVFGLAPVVNSFVTIHFSRAYKQIGPMFLAGLILVVAGAVTVLVAAPRPSEKVSVENNASGVKVTVVAQTADGSKTSEFAAPSVEEFQQKFPGEYRKYVLGPNWPLVLFFTLLTAVCWGVYGPTLHKGQMAMAGSRLRPFLLVGISYFLVAVILPYLILAASPDHGVWNFSGTFWSLAGGAAGAIGALGVIMAFNFGGKPLYVMPLIFGGAPVVNTFVVLAQKGAVSHIGPVFMAGLILVAAGAVTVLIFAPRAPAHAPAQVEESAKKGKEPAALGSGESPRK
ncbi:MAG TPA: hypothetical protein VG056_16535 [Pirellulales bacterium]|jgi:hypothetical protein|nr:hypothetical protein [Pirellulales bacterium]